jgi:rRNA maturation RNase YbeY
MAINYNYETTFALKDETSYSDWLNGVLLSEGFQLGELSFIFCDDDYLLELNQKYLNHDTLTDIITFDYSEGKTISGDVFISIERVYDNAKDLQIERENELLRVMAHGVLHMMGYNDKSDIEIEKMRTKETEKLKLFHVEL